MNAPSLKVAIIGFGLSGRVFHAPLISAINGFEVAAIVTANPARQEAAQTAYPSAEILATADDLFERIADIDLIVITTPNSSHVPLGRRALQAGVPAVIEKPLALSSSEALELAELASDRGIFLGAFQNRRWDSDFLTVSKLIRQGSIGDVLTLTSRFVSFEPAAMPGWRNSPEVEAGGGVLFDLGPHLVDQAVQLLGPALTVTAEINQRRDGANAPDDIFISIEHENGARSHLTGSVIGCGPVPRFHVQGSTGSITVHDRDIQEQQLSAGIRPGDSTWGLLPDPYAVITTENGEKKVPAVRGSQEQFYQVLHNHLQGRGEPPVGPGDAAYVLAVLEAAAVSARDGRHVEIADDRKSLQLMSKTAPS